MKETFRKIFISVLLSAPVAFTPLVMAQDPVADAVEAAKGAPRNQGLNRAAGDALKEAGRYAEAIQFYMKGGNLGNLGAAEAAYYMYDFEGARNYLDKYIQKRTPSEAEKDVNYTYGLKSEPIDWADYLSTRIDLGRSMLDRVEKIQVIDSVNVPAEEFFDFIKIARNAGSLQGVPVVERVINNEVLDLLKLSDIMSPAYVTESGDDMIWVGVDAEGGSTMYESSRLADDSWDIPRRMFDYATVFGTEEGTSVAYPFLMADGVSLYFAADGEESLGGLDIFLSRRDEDGFLQPSNIGMPYNSPYNDYMYAVDEQNGVGWWATDRNRIPGMVTVYTFIPQDLRINYEVGSEGLADFARVKSIASTWAEGADYSALKRRIENAAEARRQGVAYDFDFALPDGRVLHRLSDFRSAMARSAMQEYLREKKALEKAKDYLEELRRKYASGDKSLANEILQREEYIESKAADMRMLSNQVVNSEI